MTGKMALLAIGVVLTAAAQILLKLGVVSAGVANFDLLQWARVWQIWAGALCYVVAFVLYIYLLSLFDLSVVSPVMVAGVTLLVLVAAHVMGEPLTVLRLAGAAFIVIGIALIGVSA